MKDKTVADILNKYEFFSVFITKNILSIKPTNNNQDIEKLLISEAIDNTNKLLNNKVDFISLQYIPDAKKIEDKFIVNIRHKELLPIEMFDELQKYYRKNNCTFVTHNNKDNSKCECTKKG